MPTSTIPFDPTLVLGMIVKPGHIATLEKIAQVQQKVDLARDHVNALLRQKMSVDMTVQELINLGATPDQLQDLDDARKQLLSDIASAANDLASQVVTVEKQIMEIKGDSEQTQIGTQLQSPIDFSASQLKSMPLSSDSMNMDVQYFRWEENEQHSNSKANSISSFVGAKVSSFLGGSIGSQMAASTHTAVTGSSQGRQIIGTLVICANCTSRQAQQFSPLVLDVDAAIDSYNKQSSDKMPTGNVPQMRETALTDQSDDDGQSLPVLIGASYGSSFVGFVHFEKIDKTQSFQESQSASLQARVEAEDDLFFSELQGSFGMDAQSASSVKNLLSSDNIQSHCSLITMGLIPSIKSSQVESSVKALQGDPKSHMAELAAMQSASDDSVASMNSGAASAKKGQQVQKMKSDYIKAAVDAVAEVDKQKNNVIDLNSLQTAFDDYVTKAGDGKTGVPINFYLKYVTKRDIALAWMQKNAPNQLYPKPKGGDTGGTT